MLKDRDECIEYIHSMGRFGKKAGLDNIEALLNCLDNPQKELKCIHIAGTNGKGSVSSMLSSVLCEAGFKVGLNTSPYIEHFSERLRINGVPIEDEKLIRYTNIIRDKITENKINPIEFEMITAMGFLYFKDEKCDFVILECGLGGRFDATNIIEKSCFSAITPIGLDHTEILGDTIEKIAFEKAGIIKKDCPVVLHSDMDKRAFEVIKKIANEKKSPLYVSAKSQITASGLDGTDFIFEGESYHLSLLGEYQAGNAALAISCAKILSEKYPISQTNIKNGIKKAFWPCRFEYIKDKKIIIDGAHNFHGFIKFAESVKNILSDYEKVFVIGMLNDKDFDLSAQVISNLGGRVIVTDVPSARQTDGKSVFECVKKHTENCIYIPDYAKALNEAKTLVSKNGIICVAGSLYLAGAVRKLIK